VAAAATARIYPLALHDALPIFEASRHQEIPCPRQFAYEQFENGRLEHPPVEIGLQHVELIKIRQQQSISWHCHPGPPATPLLLRSEEHTSELQSREKLVCRLLL